MRRPPGGSENTAWYYTNEHVMSVTRVTSDAIQFPLSLRLPKDSDGNCSMPTAPDSTPALCAPDCDGCRGLARLRFFQPYHEIGCPSFASFAKLGTTDLAPCSFVTHHSLRSMLNLVRAQQTASLLRR